MFSFVVSGADNDPPDFRYVDGFIWALSACHGLRPLLLRRVAVDVLGLNAGLDKAIANGKGMPGANTQFRSIGNSSQLDLNPDLGLRGGYLNRDR
jgi:hypothetical protein